MTTKAAPDGTKQFAALLKKLPAPPSDERAAFTDPIDVLIESFLLWESSTEKARAAHEKIMKSVVDLNDLRVTMPHEMVDVIGVRYPRALDRSQRLRATLRDVFMREHVMSLASLKTTGKRDARKYLETLDGIVPYVVSRVLLVGLGSHAIPVDEQLRDALAGKGAADGAADTAEISAWLTRQVKAGEGLVTHLALQAWVEGGGAKPAPRRSRAKKPAATGAASVGASTKKETATKAPSTESKKKTKTRTRAKASAAAS